jgi:TetR/AcrR family transcriptional regulator
MKQENKTTLQKILASAQIEFAKDGLDGARIDKIASRAGVNKAMIYYHFRSKEHLYRAVVEKHFKRIGQLLEEAISEEPTLEATLNRVSRLYHSIFEDQDNFVPIFLREMARGGRKFQTVWGGMISEMKSPARKVKELMEKNKKSGSLRNLDSRQAIISFLGMNLGYLIMAPFVNSIWEIKDEKKFRKERPRQVVDLFLHGLKAKNP